ncbi:MAG: EamA family transporter [Alphaproteobacteria bacterium]|nr:EamA family transporter [Alphaproteobacteria bacterium]
MISQRIGTGPLFAIASAALFGASTPLAKLLLGGGADPWLLAGILYFGSGIGLTVLWIIRHGNGTSISESPLRRADLPWMALMILSGGVAGPLLLMLGLSRTSASSAALLLNLEGVATMGIAWAVFKENFDRRILLGAASILLGAILLSSGGGLGGVSWGALLIAGAGLAWGIDNNLTRKLSASDPVQIAAIKGVVAGSVNSALAFFAGSRLPGLPILGSALALGFVGYGVSLVFFVLALRDLGSARTGAYFSTAPFIGAALAVVLVGDKISTSLIVAGVLMALGLYLHLVERHSHDHLHEALEHEHRHIHDEHHQHSHTDADPPGEPHAHWHKHAPMTHAHPHYPDIHHRHGHS